MKTAENKSTHSQQHTQTEHSSGEQEHERPFFSESAPQQSPFFNSGAASWVQGKFFGEQTPFFSPSSTATIQRMPAFESEENPIQAKIAPGVTATTPQIQLADTKEQEPEEDTSTDTDLQAKLASNAVDPPEDVGESSEGLPFTQAKLTIGKPNDRYEQEADAVANQVVAMPKQRANLTPGLQTKPLSKTITKLAQRQVASVQPKRLQRLPKVQKQGDGNLKASSDVASRLSSSRGRGSNLDENTRGEMESSIGADFGNVRVHTGSEATQLSQDLGAKAFTHGSDLYFNQGQYNPTSSEGKHLLAHELTHTIQQGATIQKQPLRVSQRTSSPMVQGSYLANRAEKIADAIPGYFLFKVIYGKSPITGKEVPPTGINILRGVLTLLPGVGEQWFKQLKKTGAADKAGAWLDKEMAKLNIRKSINAVVKIVKKGLFYALRHKAKIKAIILATAARVRQFVRNVSGKIKEFILAAALKLAGPMGAKVLAFFKKSKETFAKILANPVQFIKNFLSAFAQGFSQFGKNIAKHLKGAIIGWLLGSLSSTGVDVQIPKTFDAKSVFGLVAQVLGFTYEGIKARLLKHPKVKALGPKATKVIELLEKSVGFVKELATKGPIVLWEKVEQSLGNLKQMVFDKLKQWVVFQVIGKAIAKLLLMMNPAGALLAVAEGIYKVVMFFIDRWDQIKSLVVSIFGSIRDIAFGNLKKAVAYVEKVLATGLTLAISFMARYVGLGGIGKAVLEILRRIQKPIKRTMERVIGWLVKKVKALWKKARKGVKKLLDWWKKKKESFRVGQEFHSLYYKGNFLMLSSTNEIKAEDKFSIYRKLINQIIELKINEVEDKKAEKLIIRGQALQKNEVKARQVAKPTKRTIKQHNRLIKSLSNILTRLMLWGKRKENLLFIEESLGIVEKDLVAEIYNQVNPTGKDRVELAYVANAPTTPNPQDKTPIKIAKLYLQEGFQDLQIIREKFGLVVGVNSYKRIDQEEDHSIQGTIKDRVKTATNISNFMMGVIGFQWYPIWTHFKNGLPTKLTFKEARAKYKNLSPKNKKTILNIETKSIKAKIIPYLSIRHKIANHKYTKNFLEKLRAQGKDVKTYLHLTDGDAVHLRASTGKKREVNYNKIGFQVGEALYERYDRFLQNNENAILVVGGYEFRTLFTSIKEPPTSIQIAAVIGNEIDNRVRKAMASKGRARAIYPADMNIIVRIQNNKDLRVIATGGSSEGRKVRNAVIKKFKILADRKDLFLINYDLRLVTSIANRFLINLNESKTKPGIFANKPTSVNANWIEAYLKHFSLKDLESLMRQKQSHANIFSLQHFHRMYEANFQLPQSEEISMYVNNLWRHYFQDIIELFKLSEAKTKKKKNKKLTKKYGEITNTRKAHLGFSLDVKRSMREKIAQEHPTLTIEDNIKQATILLSQVEKSAKAQRKEIIKLLKSLKQKD